MYAEFQSRDGHRLLVRPEAVIAVKEGHGTLTGLILRGGASDLDIIAVRGTMPEVMDRLADAAGVVGGGEQLVLPIHHKKEA